MPDILRLDRLRQLREQAGLTQADMARLCGLHGRLSYQTAGAWERGLYAPAANRRAAFLAYLWDGLRLRRNPADLAQVWAMLVEEWGWEPLSAAEWAHFSPTPLPTMLLTVQPAGNAGAPVRPAPFLAPAAPAHFANRREELAALRRDLRPGDSPRIVALTGMGGIGKTALAAHLAHDLRPHFVDGVLWAQAAGDERALALSWGQAYGYDFSTITTVHGVAAALRGILAARQALLVLDGVEAAQQVQPLLPGSGNCVVLITTRSQETAAALGARIVAVPELSAADGVTLLAQIMGAGRVENEREAAYALSRRLEGLPLALEIAGQLLMLRQRSGLAQMAARLEVAARGLHLQISDRAVRASFVLSWEALSAPLRRAFACLGVFGGRAFGVEALAAVTALDVSAAGEQLYALCARSLLAELDGPRFRQHSLLAEFAREQLGDDVEPWLRLAAYYGDFARVHTADPAQLRTDWDNLAAGMAAAHAHRQWPLVIQYAGSLAATWFAGGDYDLARTGCAQWAEAATAAGDHGGLAQALRRWAQACIEQDDYAAAAPLLAQAQAVAVRAGVALEVANIVYLQARMAVEQGRYVEAQTHLDASLSLYRELQDAEGYVRTLHQSANIAYDQGRLLEAQQLCRAAASLLDAPPRCLIAVHRLLADIAIEQDDFAAAAGWCSQALMSCEQAGEHNERGPLHYLLAVIARCTERYDQALADARQSEALAARMGDIGFQGLAVYEQSRVMSLLNDLVAAEDLGQEALALMRACQAGFNEVYALNHLGEVAWRRGDQAEAIGRWQAALAVAEARQHPLAVALAQRLAESSSSEQGT